MGIQDSKTFSPGFVIYQDKDRVEINISDSAPGGGTRGEFAIRWHQISGPGMTPRLEAFDDSWEFLAWLAGFDFFPRLSGLSDNASVEEVAAMLVEFGIEDRTPRERE